MGKISEALKKVMEEREAQKAAQNMQSKPELAAQARKAIDKSSIARETGPSHRMTLKEKVNNIFKDATYVVRNSDSSGIDPRIISYFDSASPIAEQYRMLRTNIKSYLAKKSKAATMSGLKTTRTPKVFMMTSGLHGEGKTITSVNLAVTLAKEFENKVLLVDCDLRNGMVHSMLNIDSAPGLTHILSSDYDYSVALHTTNVPNLFVMPRGEALKNPCELLSSKKMHLILEKLKIEPFTHIIIDTPPIVPFSDAAILAPYADASVLVVQAYRSQNRIVNMAKELIQQAHGNFFGFVLTQTDYYIPDLYNYYYYYHYYHRNAKSGELKVN